MKKVYFFIVVLSVAFVPQAIAQNISNEGKEFWAVFPTHVPNGQDASITVFVTSRFNTSVTVSCGAYSRTQTITANTSVPFDDIPRSAAYIANVEANTVLPNRGIHIKVKDGMPKVSAYAHIYAGYRSAATLLIPYESLGQKYYSVNYTQTPGGNNTLVLAAVEENTKLILYDKNKVAHPITLANAGDVYEYISGTDDITGVYVETDASSSCKRFAAFSGSSNISIGDCNRNTGSDPLYQQLYPTSSWGKTYGIMPFNDQSYFYRVVAGEDATKIYQNGSLLTTLNKGEFYTSPRLSIGSFVTADKNVLLAQYMYSSSCASVIGSTVRYGDPDMVLLNSIEFNIKAITVFSSDLQRIYEKYINVLIKTEKRSTFKINGSLPSANWITLPGNALYSYAQIPVFASSLTLTADDGFNAIAYGYGDVESYAYSAGTNLASTSSLSLLNLGSGLNSSTYACLGQPTNLQLTVPYLLSKIIWNFNDSTPPYADVNLGTPMVTLDNSGAKLYTYTSPVAKEFKATGIKNITATAILAVETAPPCFDGTDLIFNFDIEVVPLGNAKFEIPDICAGTPIQFFDASNVAGSSVAQWKWDFDGTIKTDKDPLHTFAQGTHTIKLAVANSSGCWSDVYTRTFSVNKDFPKLDFVRPRSMCVTDGPIQLKATEKLGLGVLNASFTGTGISPSGVFDPSVAGVGIHTINYTFTSTANCTDKISQDIEVYAITKINIEPIIYILSGGQKMMPVAIDNANATYKYKYKWTPSAGLSAADILTPTASPEKDTEYHLSVTIDGQCEVTTKIFVKVLGEINPPNSFSPNGDGINDVWNIKSIDSYPEAIVQVFNRNGQKVFSSIGYAVPFDGTYQNEHLPVGVYYYTISPKNGRKAITGPLTIIK